MGAVDEFLDGLEDGAQGAFERVRAVATDVVPDAAQGKSYGIAALIYRGKPLVGFSLARTHLSVVPFSPAAVDAARPWLEGFDVSKGTVRFTTAHPVPEEALRAMIAFRADEIARSSRG